MPAVPSYASAARPEDSNSRSSGGEAEDSATADALAEVYDQHFPMVWRTLRRFGVDESLRDDAAQDVFMVALRRQAQFRGQSSYRTWLFGIAVNVAREYRRKVRRSTQVTTLTVDEPVSPASPLDYVSQQEALQFLEQFLELLDESRRTIFVMAELEQMPAPEIAQALGVKLNTVYSRLRSARQAFVTALARRKLGASP